MTSFLQVAYRFLGEARARPSGFVEVILIVAFGTLPFVGCKSPEVALKERESEVYDLFAAEVDRSRSFESVILNWDDALVLTFQNNLELREARNRVLLSEENKRRVFLDLLPSLDLNANLRKALTDLGEIDADDLSFSVFSFVSVPGLVNMRTRWYSANLENIRAEWALELKKRELVIRLHELFVRQRILAQRERSLTFASILVEQSPDRRDLLQSPAALERQSREWLVEREQDSLSTEIARLVGSNAANWSLAPAGFPAKNYHNDPIDWDDLESVGLLLRRLQAVELEGARIRELGVKLTYWPDVNVALSSPPLYQRVGGQSRDWNFDDVLLTTSSNLRFDTQLRTTYQLRNVRRQTKMMTLRLQQENAQTIQRVKIAQRAHALNRQRLKLTDFRLDEFRRNPVGGRGDGGVESLERILLLDEQRAVLDLEQTRLEALFWILDEKRWSAFTFPSSESADGRIVGKDN